MSSSVKLCISQISIIHLVFLVSLSESVQSADSSTDSPGWRYVWVGPVLMMSVLVMLMLLVMVCIDKKRRRISDVDKNNHSNGKVRTVSIGMQDTNTSITPVNHIDNSAQSIDLKKDGKTRRTSLQRISSERRPSVIKELC